MKIGEKQITVIDIELEKEEALLLLVFLRNNSGACSSNEKGPVRFIHDLENLFTYKLPGVNNNDGAK